MNPKRIILTALALFVTVFFYEFLVHSILLKDLYVATAHLWRTEAEMNHYMPCMIVGYLFYSVFFTIIFAKGFESGKSGVSQGVRFGILIAFLLAPIGSLIWYSILPIPQNLAIDWFLASFVENVLLGLIAGLIYRPR